MRLNSKPFEEAVFYAFERSVDELLSTAQDKLPEATIRYETKRETSNFASFVLNGFASFLKNNCGSRITRQYSICGKICF